MRKGAAVPVTSDFAISAWALRRAHTHSDAAGGVYLDVFIDSLADRDEPVVSGLVSVRFEVRDPEHGAVAEEVRFDVYRGDLDRLVATLAAAVVVAKGEGVA